MKMVIDNIKSERYNFFVKMAKTLQLTVVEVELTEDKKDAKLLAAMEAAKDEPNLTYDEAIEFEKWLHAVGQY